MLFQAGPVLCGLVLAVCAVPFRVCPFAIALAALLAMAASTSAASGQCQNTQEEHVVLELRPVPTGADPWDAAVLAASAGPFPSSQRWPPGENEAAEKALLRKMGWRDPRGLKAYSKDALYPDLYVYFDAADRTSPINVAATKAFKCYGLDGAQFGGEWDSIRGPCAVVRAAPPTHKFMSSGAGNGPVMGTEADDPSYKNLKYKPKMSVDELVDTVRFFRSKDARAIALKRDAQRTMATAYGMGAVPPSAMPGMPHANNGVYFGPAGVRANEKVHKDGQVCRTCGKSGAVAGKVSLCSVCRAEWYCSTACQKADWKRHRKTCTPAGAPPATA